MDKEQEYNPDLITVQDDEGNEHIFEELDRIETDQGRYVAMLPTFDSEEEMLEIRRSRRHLRRASFRPL